MNNRDKTFLQKLKDNAYYVALGLGLLAILAVVAVYTIERGEGQLASNEADLSKASDYFEADEVEEVAETNGATADQKGTEERATLKEDLTTERKVTTEATTEQTTEAEVEDTDEAEEDASLPVTADAGALDFNSEKTISWPVAGEVILPYSMETTVYFKTLDQYKCNPGILIAAGNGTTVQNAYLGQVTKVTSDNVYGNMVTVYLGNDYSVVYGQLDTIYVKEGDFVKAGQSIGTIGNPTDTFQEEGSHLFFQFYEGDVPVDPMLYME